MAGIKHKKKVRGFSQRALLIVDVQRDFCPGGALAVAGGDWIIPVMNKYIEYFSHRHWPVFASRDWHPENSKHFKTYGGLWPVHCVQNTSGAEFHPQLNLPTDGVVISKGMDPEDRDAYSDIEAFDDQGRMFPQILKGKGVLEVWVGGLATDYCVRCSVLDLLKSQFKVNLLVDAIAGVDLNPGDSQKAIQEMAAQGAKLIKYSDLSSGF